jgi:hypothetical protein
VNLYRLESTVTAGGDIFDLRNPKGRISSFFIWNSGSDKHFQFSKPRAEAQPMIRLQDVLKSDYLKANIGVPIFSEKARSVLSAALPGEIQFYECLVRCQGLEIPFFLGKALMYLPLVDKEQSDFRTLSGGERILTRAVYRATIEQDFSIARDDEFHERLVVSQSFVALCRREALNLKFAEPL